MAATTEERRTAEQSESELVERIDSTAVDRILAKLDLKRQLCTVR
jgi:hypothetical protein